MRRALLSLILLVACLWASDFLWGSPGQGADWPQWMGPLRDGTSPVQGVFGQGAVRLREVWRKPVDRGIAALVIAGDRLYSVAASEGQEYAFAWEARTGKELWRVPIGEEVVNLEFGPASTPATDGRRVFILSSSCRLLALEAASGKLAWQVDLKARFNPGPMPNGCWTSPLLDGERLIVQVNGEPDKRVMAFHTATGDVAWAAAGTLRAVRTSPSIARLGGERQVLVHHGTLDQKGGIYALRPEDGALLWQTLFTVPESYSFDAPIPLSGDLVALVGWNEIRAVQVRKGDKGLSAEEVWSSREIRAEIQPFKIHAVPYQGHVYGLAGDFLACLDIATGKTIWKEKVYRGSLILVDGHLVVLSQAGGFVRLVEATPVGYRLKASSNVFPPGALSDTPPSFAGRRIYLRNSEEIVTLEVEADADKE